MSTNFHISGTNIKYYEGTSSETQKGVNSGVIELSNKTTKNRDFLSGITIHVANDCKTLPEDNKLCYIAKNNSRRKYIGVTIHPILNNNQKEIVIRSEYSNLLTKIGLKKGEKFSNTDLKSAVLHEIGHLFDNSFGITDKELLNKMEQVDFNNPTKEDFETYDRFMKTQDLSDSEEFQNAWKKDVEALGKNSDAENIIEKLRHYAPGRYVNSDDDVNNDINIFDGIDKQELINADYERSECFAQLFSYALNSEDSKNNTKLILETYKNSFEVIKKYISEYLGVINNE